jgi:geranylgeranylglycerol-phosphate geranylgeranyltransferase
MTDQPAAGIPRPLLPGAVAVRDQVADGGQIHATRHSSPARRALLTLWCLALAGRPRACLAGAGSVLLGVYLAAGTASLARAQTAVASAGIALAIVVANMVNDIFDIKVDAVGNPERPLPSGRISLRTARTAAALAAFAAIGLAAAAGTLMALWMTGLLTLAICYSWRLKSTVLAGNLVVASCASVPVVFGAAVTGTYTPAVWAAAGMCFVFMLSYEVFKTIADGAADAQEGLATVATVMGTVASARLLRLLAAVFTAEAVATGTTSPHPLAYLVLVLLACVVPVWYAILTAGGMEDGPPRRSLWLMRTAWFLGMIVLLLLR